MTPAVYEAGVALWRHWWHDLPACAQGEPPDMFAVQPFDMERGDFINYHSDGQSSYEDQTISMRIGAPVYTLNLFADFDFWHHPMKKRHAQASRCRAAANQRVPPPSQKVGASRDKTEVITAAGAAGAGHGHRKGPVVGKPRPGLLPMKTGPQPKGIGRARPGARSGRRGPPKGQPG